MESNDIAGEIERAALLVEGVIQTLGLDPASVRMPAPAHGRAWSLMRGSAAVAIFLRPPRDGEDSAQLRVVAPIVKVESRDEVALYRTLLELNASGLGSVAFGLHHGRIVIVAERRTRDLDAAEVEYVVHRVGAVGDRYDDELIARFGGTRVSDLP